tara:strand:+ start:68 stop:940 length:873 start_codon:yes stop_codon:yes gene_type:complete
MEIMIAATLLAMMGMILGTSISAVLGAIRDNREMQDRYHAARVALGRMQREVAMAYLSKHQGEQRSTKTIFLGKSNRLAFSYMGHRQIARGSIESDQGVVEYFLDRGTGGGLPSLIRREKVIIDDVPEKEGRRQVLAEDVRKLEFEYWNMDKESWEDDWKVEIDRAVEEQRQKEQAAARATGMTGNADLANAMVNARSRQQRHGPDEQWLPGRVRIRIILATDDEDQDLEFETQTRVRMMRPLNFRKPYTAQEYSNTLNPLSPMSGITPSSFSKQFNLMQNGGQLPGARP